MINKWNIESPRCKMTDDWFEDLKLLKWHDLDDQILTQKEWLYIKFRVGIRGNVFRKVTKDLPEELKQRNREEWFDKLEHENTIQ